MTEERHNSGSTALAELFTRVSNKRELDDWFFQCGETGRDLSLKESTSRANMFACSVVAGGGVAGAIGSGLLVAFGVAAAAPVAAVAGAVAAVGAAGVLVTQKLAERASDKELSQPSPKPDPGVFSLK
ncbi:MAG: hypothetical protein ACXW4B_11750 [Micavibrio sp.]